MHIITGSQVLFALFFLSLENTWHYATLPTAVQVSQVQNGWGRLPFSHTEFISVSFWEKKPWNKISILSQEAPKNSASQFSNLVSTSPSQCGRCPRKVMWRQSTLSILSPLYWASTTFSNSEQRWIIHCRLRPSGGRSASSSASRSLQS